MLALSAALAAACFVKAFGVTFLGRPRTPAALAAQETDRASLARHVRSCCPVPAGRHPAGLLHRCDWRPSCSSLVGTRMPLQTAIAWLSIVPVAESRSSYNGLLVFVFITISTLAAIEIIHRFASRAVRRGPAWDCGFPDPSPATQYTADSFAQPIRRVFGAWCSGAREHVDMPAPGDARPARLTVTLRDLVWDAIYAPDQRRRLVRRREAQPSAVPDHSPIPEPGIRRSRWSPVRSDAGDADMDLILELIVQGAQMVLVLVLAPLLLGLRARSRRACCAGADRRCCSPTATCCG